jgi:hypothetical protein
MPDEEKKEEKEETRIFPILVIFSITFFILGLIIALVLKKSLLIAIGGAFVGILVGIAFFFYSKAPPSTKKVINIVVIAAVVIVVGVFIYRGISELSMPSFFFDIFSFFKKGFLDLRCTLSEQCLFQQQQQQQQQQFQLPDFRLSLEYFDDYIENGAFDFFVKLKLMNQKLNRLVVRPYCYKKSNNESLLAYSFQSYAMAKEFVFPTSQQELETGFRCKGTTQFQKETIVIGLEIPYQSNLTFIVFVKATPEEISQKKGIQNASVGPYVLAIDMPADMPLKDGQYEFFVKLNKNYDVEMKELRLKIASNGIDVYCAGSNEISLRQDELKKYKAASGYVFPCTMQIAGASSLLEKRFITAVADYVVYKEFEKDLREREK